MLRKTIKIVDKGIDRIVLIVSLLFFLICIYAMIDAVMVYYNANDQGVLKFKPQGKEDAAVLRELSDDAVAWLTVDGTTIDYLLGVTPIVTYAVISYKDSNESILVELYRNLTQEQQDAILALLRSM